MTILEATITPTHESMLTTLDNPYSPFTNFDQWFAFDTNKNYNSCSYLARVARISDDLSEADTMLEIERAIDEIVQLNVLGVYAKVTRKLEETKEG